MRTSIKLLCFISLLWATSCLDDPDCVTTTPSTIRANFYNGRTGDPDTVQVNSIRVSGSDSLLVSGDTLITGLTLPLNPSGPESVFSFDTDLGIDTLVIVYHLGTRFISPDCGVEFIYTDLDYSRVDFDSVQVINPVPIENSEDVKIFN